MKKGLWNEFADQLPHPPPDDPRAEFVIQALRRSALGDAVVDAEQPGDATIQGYFDLQKFAAEIIKTVRSGGYLFTAAVEAT